MSIGPVKVYLHRQIFNFEFNIDFHKPKSDQCDKCYSFDIHKATKEEFSAYELHKKSNKETQEERAHARSWGGNDCNLVNRFGKRI